jgi:NADH-quinone oxidoreductase subunit M
MNSAPMMWSQVTSYPLLWALQVLPALGAVAIFLLRGRGYAVTISRAVAVGELWLAAELVRRIDPASAALQLGERVDLLGYPVYHAGADGITALFVLLTALLTLLLTLYGLVRGLASVSRLAVVILAAEATLMSMLVTLNVLWFAVASAAELGLVAYLLGRWSTSSEENRSLAMTRFIQFQGGGMALFMLGIGILAWGHADTTGRWSFDLLDLMQIPPEGKFQSAAFFLMFYGLAIRTPLFPLHGWLPHVAQRGMVAVAPALLLGIKVGIYGMLRFVLPLTPDAVVAWQPYVVGFAMVGVFYSAVLAFLQTNLRRLLAFAVVSHTSLIVIGLFSLEAVGLQGAVLLTVNFGLAVTVMLFMVGFVFRRTHTTYLDQLGDLFERIPFIASVFLVGGLSIVGMPGTPGFDAAHLVLEASIERFGALPTVAAALGNVAAAGFLLWGFQRAFLSPRVDGMHSKVERTQAMEYFVGGLALAILLITGFYSEPWLNLTDAAAKALGARFGHG